MNQITQTDYNAFLQSKICLSPDSGFEVEDTDVHPVLKPFQRAVVRWALRGGRRLLAESFGLGKTLQQIELLRITTTRFGGLGLIVLPLGVRQEFHNDAKLVDVAFKFIRTNEELEEGIAEGYTLFLTNYESVRDGKLDPSRFLVVSLDEGDCLRGSGTKTYHTFIEIFASVPYRFVATATPSPNDFIEILNYAGFLGIIDKSQAKTRFFDRDPKHADNLILRANMREEFWAWVHSWALFLQKPSQLGFSDAGYDLPPLNVLYHEVDSEQKVLKADGRGQFKLMRDAGAGLSEAAAEKRESLVARVCKMLEIIEAGEETEPGAHYLLWHDLEAERHAIKIALPEAVSVYGTQDMEEREQAIRDFSDGKFRFLSTKPEIAGAGCNFQRHCHNAIFTGIGYKFRDFIQSIHRIQRFLQEKPCTIHVIHTEAEREILKALLVKWDKHDETVAQMSKLIAEFGLGAEGIKKVLSRRIGCERREVSGKLFTLVNNDTVVETAAMETDSVDMIATSIPFGTQYEYSENYNDFGHNEDHKAFWRQMDFLTPNLLRILKPGRICAVHTKDRINFGNYSGYGFASVEPFHAECMFHFIQHGFVFMGMITVTTDVVKENNQTYRLGWTECCKDGTKMGVGSPEYILLFRKIPTDRSNSYADMPVERSKVEYTRARWQIDAHAHWKSSGARLATPDEMLEMNPKDLPRTFAVHNLERPYDYDEHVHLGEELEKRSKLSSNFMMLAPSVGDDCEDVWTDVVRQLTINGTQTARGFEKHVCPLQFDIVDRLIDRYTNKGELVYDPFAGLGTFPMRAVKHGRRGRGHELNATYFQYSVGYLREAEEKVLMPDLFSMDEGEGE